MAIWCLREVIGLRESLSDKHDDDTCAIVEWVSVSGRRSSEPLELSRKVVVVASAGKWGRVVRAQGGVVVEECLDRGWEKIASRLLLHTHLPIRSAVNVVHHQPCKETNWKDELTRGIYSYSYNKRERLKKPTSNKRRDIHEKKEKVKLAMQEN